MVLHNMRGSYPNKSNVYKRIALPCKGTWFTHTNTFVAMTKGAGQKIEVFLLR